MEWEWKINIGNVLSLAALLVTLVTLHTQNIRRIAKIEEQLDIMYGWFKSTVVNRREEGD
jgi:hypothetical protein